MAIDTPVLVASGSNTAGATSVAAAANQAIAAGETLLAFYGLRDDLTPSAPSVTDDAITPTAYTADDDDNSAEVVSFITHASVHRLSNNSALDGPTPGPAENITASITSTGITSSVLAVLRVAGLDLSAPLDVASAVANGNGTAVDSGNITPTAGERLLVGWLVVQNDNDAFGDDPDFTEIANVVANTGTNANSTRMQVAYRIVTADGLTAYNFAQTLAGNRNWVCGIRAYKAASTPATGTGSISLGAPSVSASGHMAADGQGDIEVGAADLTAAGEMPFEGEGSLALEALELSASGLLVPAGTADLIQQQAVLTTSGEGGEDEETAGTRRMRQIKSLTRSKRRR